VYRQMGFDQVTSSKQMNQYGTQGFITVEGKTITVQQKIESFRASIAWAEEQLALTRKYPVEERCARPDDWIILMDELEADLNALLAVEQVAA
jgi:hypothetical protein